MCTQVYCEMGLHGGGYTFINPQDFPSLTNDEIQAMFTDKASFLWRIRNEDSSQPYAVFQQLQETSKLYELSAAAIDYFTSRLVVDC